MRTLFVRVRVSLCFSFSSVGLALSGADAPAVPLFGFAIFPRPGEIFPKGGALGKEGKLFLYPLYSFALANLLKCGKYYDNVVFFIANRRILQ